MASYLVQSGTSLTLVSRTGVQTAVTLPSGVTLTGATNPVKAVLFGSTDLPWIVAVGGITKDIYIGQDGVARVLQVAAPTSTPTLAAGASTGLTGAYTVWTSFKIKDATGRTILESALSPASTPSSALANNSLLITAIPVSSEGTVNARGIYRSLSGGNVPYPWFDIDDNVTLSDDRGVADAVLSLLPTSSVYIGTPPDLSLITTWKDRLWATPRNKPDYVRWTEDRSIYAWNAANELVVPPQLTDAYGVTAYIPRRDQLGIARRDRLFQVTGDDNDSFQRGNVSETLGCIAPESVVIIRDIAYWLGERGVVEWSSQSIGYVSDAQVAPYFGTGSAYFNATAMVSAQGRYNPDTDSYELLLPSAGQTSLDRWISYDIRARRWFGPHKTGAFTPTCCANNSKRTGFLTDTNSRAIAVFGGSDGYLHARDSAQKDDEGTAIALSVDLPFFGGDDPDLEKVWLDPTIMTRKEVAGTLTITPIVGELSDSASTAITHDMTLERERLSRIGRGRYCQLNLSHSAVSQAVRIHGIELPYVIVGRR